MTVPPMTPSETLGALRNDGRSLHHHAEAHKAVDRLEERLEDIKALMRRLGDGPVVGCACAHSGGVTIPLAQATHQELAVESPS